MRHRPPPDGPVQVLPGVKLHDPQHAVALSEDIGVGRFDHLAKVILHERSGEAFSAKNKLGAACSALLQLLAQADLRSIGPGVTHVQKCKVCRHRGAVQGSCHFW